MSLFKEIVGRVCALWGLMVLTAIMFILFPFYILCYLMKEPYASRWHRIVCKVWMGSFLYLSGCSFRIKGKEYFSDNSNYIIVCNHNSLIDVALITPFMPRANKTIAKKNMASIPFFGWIYALGAVLIDRKNADSRRRGFAEMHKVLLQWNLDMVVYPEGTRNKTTKPLMPFHSGAFLLSVETGKPIMPVVLFNTRKVLPADKLLFMQPHHLEIHFLHPITPVDKTADGLKEEVFNVMYEYIGNTNITDSSAPN